VAQINGTTKAYSNAYQAIGIDIGLGEQSVGHGNSSIDRMVRATTTQIGVDGMERVVLEIGKGGAQAIATQVDTEDIALITEYSPAILGQTVLDECLQFGHEQPPLYVLRAEAISRPASRL